MSEQPMSLAQVTELPDGAWINGGFTAVIQSTERKIAKKSNKPFWVCQLGDTTGSATAEMSMFKAPAFKDGDQVEFLGQGMKFSVTQYGNKVSISDKTEIHVIGQSVHHQEQKERAADIRPSVNGSLPAIGGQTVGMAMKESIALVGMSRGGITGMATLRDPLFWEDVKVVAGAIIRISRSLEAGKLSPPPWPVKQAAPPATTALAAQRTPPPQSRGSSPEDERRAANLAPGGTENLDEDVPF